MRKSSVLCVGLVLGSASAFGQTVFVAATGSTTPTPGQTITAKGGDVLTLEVWVQDIPEDKLREFQAAMPCTASGGTFGSIDYSAGLPIVYDGDGNAADPDYVFAGLPRVMRLLRAGECPLNQLDSYPAAARGVNASNAVAPSVPKYMATFTYNVSTNAQGTFTLQAQPVASTCPAAFGSYLLKGIVTVTCYPTTYTALTINVHASVTGACCELLSGRCAEDVPSGACSGTQQAWTEGAACVDVACEAVPGACCDHGPFGACTDGVTQAACDCPTCDWVKLGSCSELDCPHTAIPTVGEWGLAILTLLLLTGAKIYFGRSKIARRPR